MQCVSRFRKSLSLAAILIAVPGMALANMPIFLVFAGVRITLWWTVLLAIAIKAAALHYRLWNETADPRYSVRTILPLSGQD